MSHFENYIIVGLGQKADKVDDIFRTKKVIQWKIMDYPEVGSTAIYIEWEEKK